MSYMPEADNTVVLVADGDVSVLKNVSSMLGKAGFTVLTAHGGPAALDVCEHHREPIQLAIVDMAMSGNGPLLVERLYGSYPGIRILFTSSSDESATVRQVGRSGRVREFLQKPFRRSQLLGRVLQVMDAPLAHTA
jgi:CheY-like chemotaxis protein